MTEPTAASAAPTVSPALVQAPVLAHVVRGGVVESVHRASVVVTAADGSTEWVLGDADGLVFPRSSNKPLQAVALLRAGWDPTPEQLALACASHLGEPFHLETARGTLADAGLAEGDLQNTPDYPIDEPSRLAWIRAGHDKEAIAQNCSGKHAGMLAACVAGRWDPATYRDPEHPLQQLVTRTVAELAGSPVGAVVVDGCGAPQHGFALAGLARAFGRVAAGAEGTPERRVAEAVGAHPEHVSGTGRPAARLIAAVPGLVAKEGAEAVFAVGLPDGRGVAVKVADGGGRAASVLLAAALRRAGLGRTADEQAALAALEDAPVLGHGERVGSVVAVGV